ncbi:MAG: hypothetical protein IJS28_07180 [Synergistaceae bacterium]|nr:hypothetical protein [Synergistaceae bacterium]
MNYCDALFELMCLPQWRLLRKERGYSEIMPDIPEYLCFREHTKIFSGIITKMSDCETGKGEYALMSANERRTEWERLEVLRKVHTYKAHIFATACGYRLV